MDIFEPLAGAWMTTFESRPSQANPETSTGEGELSGKMILGGRFFQVDGYAESLRIGRQDFLVIITYDEQQQTYRRWVFRSDGVTAESTGVWNADEKTLTWSTIGLPEGTTFTVTQRITDDGVEETLFGKRADGTVSTDVTLSAKKKL